MDTTTRQAVREQLDLDDRVEHTAQLRHLLNRAAKQLRELQLLVEHLPIDPKTPIALTAVVSGLARQRCKRLERGNGVLDQLLERALEQSIILARAHGVTWKKIGEALEEDGRNTASRFPHQR